MKERASSFRAKAALLNGGREGRRKFSSELRAEALEYMTARRSQGAKYEEIQLELGLGISTLDNWRRRPRQFRKVVALPRKASKSPPPFRSITVSTTSGIRIDGLAMSEVIELVKALA
jgi:transposase-like protein